MNDIEEDEDTLNLFKVIFTNGSSWKIVKDRLNTLLKSKQPEAIRAGLLNLMSSKMMSNYLRGEIEGWILCDCFNKLKSYYGHLEKANIIMGVFDIYRNYNMMIKLYGEK